MALKKRQKLYIWKRRISCADALSFAPGPKIFVRSIYSKIKL